LWGLLSLVPLSVLPLLARGRLATIPYSPERTPETWLEKHPHVNVSLGSWGFVLTEPSSSLLVYSLGFLAIVLGFYFFRIRDNHQSRLWWGIALMLWGIGALLGGTDYQALSYELKCAGKEACSYVSWVEIYYYLASIASVNAMVLAVAHSSAGNVMRRVLPVYAVANAALYSALCLTGAFVPNKFLVSFELLVLFAAPSYVLLFITNTTRYLKHGEKMDLALMGTWLSLGIVVAAYYPYWALGVSDELWDRGIWFNENDVLHVGLILWMLYIGFVVASKVKDLTARA
jgi:hypothetical protein